MKTKRKTQSKVDEVKMYATVILSSIAATLALLVIIVQVVR